MKRTAAFLETLPHRPLEELYLVAPEYLTPYLTYIREHRRIFQVAVEQAAVPQMAPGRLPGQHRTYRCRDAAVYEAWARLRKTIPMPCVCTKPQETDLFCRSVSFSISFSYPKALKAKLIAMYDPATIGPSDKASEKWVKEVKK